MQSSLLSGPDNHPRCWWQQNDPLYMRYHDKEWGRPLTDDFRLYEKICLEGFQAGLSWITVLRKRENFREAFRGFDFEQVAHFGEKEIETMLQNAGIIRHRRKIESAINNARRAIETTKEFGSLAAYFRQFVPPTTERPEILDYNSVMQLTETPTSRALNKDMKKRGWSFVGPTTLYAFMQSVGLVNDHVDGCFIKEEVQKEREAYLHP